VAGSEDLNSRPGGFNQALTGGPTRELWRLRLSRLMCGKVLPFRKGYQSIFWAMPS